jgi:hypothetical protein
MANGETYPFLVVDDNGETRLDGNLTFSDSTDQPAPGGNNQATVPAATATTSAPRISQLTSYLTVTSGALPQLAAAWVSGTAKVNPVARQIVIPLAISGDGTNNAATCAVAISADDSTYTTVATVSVAAAINNLGALTLLSSVTLPAGWFIKLTLSRTTVTQSYYY